MNNKIYYVSQNEIKGIQEHFQKNTSYYVAVMDGSSINTLNDYLDTMNRLFKFPVPSDGVDGYLDWIRDLSWLNKDGYVLIIKNYNQFLCNDIELRKSIIQDFEEIILPFWQEDVEKVVVEGKAKPFIVYFVK